MTEARAKVIDRLAHLLLGRAQDGDGHAVRVAVTGITAAGKSTLVIEPAEHLIALGARCVRLPVDGFHNPKSIRYRRGRHSAEGYYRDAYNYDLLLRRVLVPLGPGGDGYYVTRAFDLETDAPVAVPPVQALPGHIVILDASFLLRPEIREHFDYRIFVHTSFEEAHVRGVRRDCDSLGGVENAERLYRRRYHEAQRIYFREAEPLKWADALVANDDVDVPVSRGYRRGDDPGHAGGWIPPRR